MARRRYIARAKKIFAGISGVFAHYVKTKADQVAFVNSLQAACGSHAPATPAFQSLLHFIYLFETHEVVSEEAVTAWYENGDNFKTDTDTRLKAQVLPFITWLAEADESDSTSGSDSD